MKLILYGHTACEWWARTQARGQAANFANDCMLCDCSPTAASLEYLGRVAPFLEKPYHVLVPDPSMRRTLNSAIVHVSQFAYPSGSFTAVENGLYASSPELAFLQVSGDVHAGIASGCNVVKEGYALCGSFLLSQTACMGISERVPLTSQMKIKLFIEQLVGHRDAKRALRLAGYILDGSASPRESDLAMRLSLPYGMGGFNLKGLKMNHRVDLRARSRSIARKQYHVVDVCWPEKRLAVEYDSDAAHLNSDQLMFDAIKRSALEAEGYKVIVVTRRQLDNPDEMFKIARQIGYRLGVRVRPQVKGFADLQRRLYSI